MPNRLLLAAALALTVLALPAAAHAAELRARRGDREVPRRHGRGRARAPRAALRARTPQRALPGGSEQLAIDDGESVRETVSELRDDPNVAYAVPNYRAHAAAAAQRPGPRAAVELPRQLRDRHGGGVGAGRPARRPGRARSAGGAARQRRGLRAPRPLPARARPAALHLRQGLRLRGPRPPPQRRVRSRHPRGRHDRADHEQRGSPPPASPIARGSCPCGCSTGRARATRWPSRARSATPPGAART